VTLPFVKQPGPPSLQRIVAAKGRGRAFPMPLQPGRRLLDAVREAFASQGFSSGVLNFGSLELAPLAYVKPAPSKTPANAAFYSDPFHPAGVVRMEVGAMTFGARDGAPFFHCHALWREADGTLSGGHILPDETVLAAPATVDAIGLDGMAFLAMPEAEINFTVFGPVADETTAQCGAEIHALRLKPNQCLHSALEDYAAANGIRHARLCGGVGSTIGAVFEDGRGMPGIFTEFCLTEGTIAPDEAGRPVASIAVGIVDHLGNRLSGRLRRGANSVLMTVEIVLAVQASAKAQASDSPASTKEIM